ncbi:MAG: UpxY family transcription antiterminator [Bacteroidota bacterium]
MNTINHNQFQTNWYAIYTKPRAEKKVFSRLSSNGFNAYLPLVTTVREWSDRKKKVVSPLISSYVFVNINKEELFNTLQIQGTAGVLRYLGKPAIIRDQEIENLKILMNDTQQFSILESRSYEKGEEVEVIKGPFIGLIAKSVCIQGKHRILVEIEAMGSRLEVNVPIEFVMKKKDKKLQNMLLS